MNNDIILQARSILPVTKPRVTFQLNLYHQLQGEDAKQVTLNGNYLGEVEETLFDRTLSNVGSVWQKLDFGWLAINQIRTIILINTTGTKRQINPTDEERESDASAIITLAPFSGIEVAPGVSPTVIHVGKDFTGISVRSIGAPARLRYIGIPK